MPEHEGGLDLDHHQFFDKAGAFAHIHLIDILPADKGGCGHVDGVGALYPGDAQLYDRQRRGSKPLSGNAGACRHCCFGHSSEQLYRQVAYKYIHYFRIGRVTDNMIRVAVVILVIFSLCGCESIPLKEGGLAVGKNTTATIDDIGVGRVTNQF